MKLRIADRIIAALTGIILLALCAALIATVFFGVGIPQKATAVLDDTSLKTRTILVLAGAVTAFLGVYNILVLFRHRKRRDKFVTVKTEDGEITIGGKTIENMITRCTDQHDELSVSSVRLKNDKNGLRITLRGKVSGGVSIPLTVSALQKQIRQYVTACSGLEVKEILFRIDGSGNDAEKAAFAVDTPVASLQSASADNVRAKSEDNTVQENSTAYDYTVKTDTPEIHSEVLQDDRPLHQRIFCAPDEPCIVPPPPGNDQAETEEEKQEYDEPQYAKEETVTESIGSEDEIPEDSESENTECVGDVSAAHSAEDAENCKTDEVNKTNGKDEFTEAQNLFDSLLTSNQPE